MKLLLKFLLQALWACVALASILPRENVYASMEDNDPVVANTNQGVYTDALETCMSLTAVGATGPRSNRKVMMHVSAMQQLPNGDARIKTDRFIGAVAAAGFQQGELKIFVTAPSSHYVDRKMTVDQDFANEVNAMGGPQAVQQGLDLLVQDAVKKATMAVQVAGGTESDVFTYTRADATDPQPPEPGAVRMEFNGGFFVEGVQQ